MHCILVNFLYTFRKSVLYTSTHFFKMAEEHGATYVSMETLLSTSDVISLHVPLTEATWHLLSYPQFEMVKPGCVLINTSRGSVVHEEALVTALESGRIRSAGLDVYENEPDVHPGLLSRENVTLLPHVGTFTEGSYRKMELK